MRILINLILLTGNIPAGIIGQSQPALTTPVKAPPSQPFGTNQAATTQPSSLFGLLNQPTAVTPGLTSSGASRNLFGGGGGGGGEAPKDQKPQSVVVNDAPKTPQQGGNLFLGGAGANTTSGSLFGGQAAGATNKPSLFGGISSLPAPAAPAKPAATGLFGQPSAFGQMAQAQGSAFSFNKPAPVADAQAATAPATAQRPTFVSTSTASAATEKPVASFAQQQVSAVCCV